MAKTITRLREAATLKADETRNEETTAWCNRDLVPLPPSRRTWGWFNFFGAGSLYVDPSEMQPRVCCNTSNRSTGAP